MINRDTTDMLNANSADDVSKAQHILSAGGLVAIPTETVYGLAADATQPQAVAGIFEAKGRPADHPLIVHLSCVEQLSNWAVNIPEVAYQLADAFWPGPITFLLEKAPHVNTVVTGGLKTIGLRIPAHPVMYQLLKQSGLCVAAPSANRYKKLSPTSAEQVKYGLAGRIDAVLDGGPCQVGLESTIIDLTKVAQGGDIKVLRAGPISAEQIAHVINMPVKDFENHTLAVPGNVAAHYQPNAPLQILPTLKLKQALAQSDQQAACIYYSAEIQEVLKHNPCTLNSLKLGAGHQAYGQQLYASLFELDKLKPTTILLEQPPQTANWLAVNDRLNRAQFKG